MRNNLLIKKIINAIPFFSLLFLTGCGGNTGEAFDHVLNQTALSDMADGVARGNSAALSHGWKETLAYYTYYISNISKTFLPFIVMGSIGIGILGLILVTKDMRIRRICIFAFIITIPIISIIFTYVISFVAGSLMGQI